jgi:hypothetical protein
VSQMVQHATSEHGLARHQKMVEAESEHGSMEASEEHEIRSTEDQKMVSRSEALQGQKIRRCYAPSCLTLMIFKRRIHKHQIRRKYTWQTTLTDKRNVKATKGYVSRHSVNKARGS